MTDHTGDITGVSVTLVEAFGPNSDELLKELPEAMRNQVLSAKRQDDLTQLLGISLRDILPYAQNEITAIGDRVDDTVESQDRYAAAYTRLNRATQALNVLNTTPLSVENLTNDIFDDEFEIKFDLE